MAERSALRRATGRERDEWFVVLDGWGAPGRPYREIAEWLKGTHGLSDWWAQKLVVEYEQERGLRQPGARSDGTFEVGASRTVSVPVEAVYAAIVEEDQRRRWLDDGTMSLRTTRPNRGARFDWEEDSTRVAFALLAKDPGKTVVSVTHAKLPDAKRAASEKAAWKERLARLVAFLRG